jgi:hypothetical protein
VPILAHFKEITNHGQKYSFSLTFFTVLGKWLIELHIAKEINGNGTLPLLLTQQTIKNEQANEPKITQIGNFVVQPGVPFELRIDVPSEFKKEGEGAEQAEMEYYQGELNYDDADENGAVLAFALDRKYFPFWQIQAIHVCLIVFRWIRI